MTHMKVLNGMVAVAVLAALSLRGEAQTLGCEVGVANGGVVPSTGSGGGGSFPGVLPTVATSFTLNVASLPPGATVVTEVKLLGVTHTYIDDLQWVLTDPSGESHNLWVRSPPGSMSCDWNGDYSIVPSCTGLGQALPTSCTGAAILPPGAYEQFFGAGATAWPPGANGIRNTWLSAIAAATGAWTLTAYDWEQLDTGALASFDVCFGTAPTPLFAPTAEASPNAPLDGSTFLTDGNVQLSWNSVACATLFEVDVDGVVHPAASSPFLFASKPGLHTWRVRAVNPLGAGPWSAQRTFTDRGPPPAAPRRALVVGSSPTGPATIYAIDPSSGAALPIYASSTSESKVNGMAYDAATNTLYWTDAGTLRSSPYANPLTPTNLGPITFNGSPIGFSGLSFQNGRLYATRVFATEAVYEIDISTRVATQVFVYATTLSFGGLEHDLVTGKLYGLSDTPGLNRGLYEIDIVGQTATRVAPFPAGETHLDGLAVNDGVAYYVAATPNADPDVFFVFDVATGLQLGTIQSPLALFGDFAGATFVDAVVGGPYAYCTAGTSTNGCVPAISASAQPNLANNAGCVITCNGLEGQKLGLFFYGVNNGGFSPNPWGASNSFLCVKAPTQRTGSSNSNGVSGQCVGFLMVDWDAFQIAHPSSLGNPFSAGDSIYVQTWYRDPPSPKTTHLSDALEMTMQP